jgi:uncharacterized protein (TIGR02246 family)
MNRTIFIALAAATALSACQQTPRVDTAQIEQQLKQAEDKWNQAYAAHDAAALAGMYADDAAMANPGAALVSGRAAVMQETKAFADDPNLQVEFESDRVLVAASGDLASTRGHYTLTMTDPATKQPVRSKGNYLTVWRKQADGSWKAVEDFITPGPAPTLATRAQALPG